MKRRLEDIDRAKGLAILLVVIGHLADERYPPLDAQWYLDMKYLIYHFHMPFFMFLSGLIYFYTYRNITSLKEYSHYAVKKINRLLPPFVIFGMIILFGKMMMSGLMDIQNVGEGVIPGMVNILLYPSKSVAISLWYIYVLLEMLLIMPLVIYMTKGSNLVLATLGIVLYFMPGVPHILMIHSLFEYFIFFILGKLAIDYYDGYIRLLSKYFWLCGIFLISFISIAFVDYKISKIIIGIASIFALHGLIYSGFLRHSKLLLKIGYYSFIIYLMNTMIIGLGKGILFKFVPWSGYYFTLLYFPLLVLGTIFLSIVIKKYIFKHINYLDKITS